MFEDLHEEFSSCKEQEFLIDKSVIIPELSRLLTNAIASIKEQRIGIAFSGGLDSSLMALLAQKTGKDFTLYAIGLPSAQDLAHAGRCAKVMKWPLKSRVVTPSEAEVIVKKVKTILTKAGAVNTINLGVGSVVYAVLQQAKKDGISTILGGLGAEEIFAGYMRHCAYGKNFSPNFIQQALIEGLKGMETRDLVRDLPLAQHFNMTIATPFLERNLVRYAMRIHPSLKINKTQKKIILRETAAHLGLPSEPTWRKKVAAQYGSGFAKLIKKVNKESVK